MKNFMFKKIILVLICGAALQAVAADVTTENLPDGKQRVVAYENISEPMLESMDNCQQSKGLMAVKGRVNLQGEFAVFPAVIGKRQTEVAVDLREFDAFHKRQFVQFIKKNQSYRARYQTCGNAAVVDLIDISLLK